MAPQSQKHFLIIFDGATSRMKEDVMTYEIVTEALEAYARAEERYRDQPDVQAVLVSADSLSTVKKTHPNFWKTLDFRELAMEALKP